MHVREIVQTYSEDNYLTNKIPDMKKINSILLSIYEFNYYSVGEKIGKAWDVGKNIES